ncbi:GH22702 [Drosophila grimshawi]|uniref:GH22702 n=2 Tax=Drosophila grimshawi TaxID=7222 RepID=B4JWP3_DROGR|nr:GH22702 [Drosophila grimshawi]
MEQNSQRNLSNNVLGMLNELSEKFNKVTNLEHNIKIYKAEQIRQGNFLEELMSKIKESITELINQRTLLNEIVGKVNGSTTDRICQSDLLNKLTSLDPIQIHDRSGDNCACVYKGAWWYHDCHNSNLMGKYNEKQYGKGINWETFTNFESSLKRVQMMIRPRRK